jgi:hypothetical protein
MKQKPNLKIKVAQKNGIYSIDYSVEQKTVKGALSAARRIANRAFPSDDVTLTVATEVEGDVLATATLSAAEWPWVR